jgi:hypothetical protein
MTQQNKYTLEKNQTVYAVNADDLSNGIVTAYEATVTELWATSFDVVCDTPDGEQLTFSNVMRHYVETEGRSRAYKNNGYSICLNKEILKDHVRNRLQVFVSSVANGNHDKHQLPNHIGTLEYISSIIRNAPENTAYDKDNVKVSVLLAIDGRLEQGNDNLRYTTGRETWAFTLDDMARIVFVWEKLLNAGGTYAMDGFLEYAEKKLPKKDGETAESTFQKYWVNYKQTLNDEYEKLNKGELDSLFPEENDYLTHEIAGICKLMVNLPNPISYGFLHFVHQYVYNGDVKQYEADLANIAPYIKKLVDNRVIDQKAYKRQGQED